MNAKKLKIALVVVLGLLIIGMPIAISAQSNQPNQPLVYRFSGWWDGLHYNVLSGNRPDMRDVKPIVGDNPGEWATTSGLNSNVEYSDAAHTPRVLESAMAIAVYVDTTLGNFDNSGAGALTSGAADTARAYVALVADAVAKDVKIYESNFIKVVLDSADNIQTPYRDSLTISSTSNTVQIVVDFNTSGTTTERNGLTNSVWDVVEGSEIVTVGGEQWVKVADLTSLSNSAKCYTISYLTGLITLKSLDSTDVVSVECVLAPDLVTGVDAAVRYGGYIQDNYVTDTLPLSDRDAGDNGINGEFPDTTTYRGTGGRDLFSSWGRLADIQVLPWSAAHAGGTQQIHNYVNVYVLDASPSNDSTGLFCYSHSRYDNGFSSLSLPRSQKYRGTFSNPGGLAVISATNTNPGVRYLAPGAGGWGDATAPTSHSTDYVVTDSIRLFVTEQGTDRIVVVNGSIGFDGTILTIPQSFPATYPDLTGPYASSIVANMQNPDDYQLYLDIRTGRGGSRLNFFPDTVTTSISGDSINQIIYFNRHEESFSVLEWPKVWVDENSDGSYADSNEIWLRVNNLQVVNDTGAYQLDRFADIDGAFVSGNTFAENGPGKLMFGNGVNGRIPAAGNTWNVRVAYYPSPDMFVYDNTFADSTSGAAGQLSNPKGITARYNEVTKKVDVYVCDNGNRCVKKFLWDESRDSPGKLTFVSKFAENTDPVSVAVGRYHRGSTDADSSDVYIYVADQSNNRILVYRDDEAMAPDLVGQRPELFTTLGSGDGTELGQFHKPTDVFVVSGQRFNHHAGASATGAGHGSGNQFGNMLDLYVTDWGDNNSGRVTKIEGITNQVPTITNVTPLTAECEDGYTSLNPQSSYKITYTVSDDELSTATISLYYAPTDSASMDSSILIASGIAAPLGGRGSYDWTPGDSWTVPDTGYILGVIYDKYNQYGTDYSDCQIILDNSVPTIRFVNKTACQTDSIIVVYEGEGMLLSDQDEERRQIQLYVENPNGLTSFKIRATFDTTIINITKIEDGDAFVGGNDEPQFFVTPNYDQMNAEGWFEITGALTMTGEGQGIKSSGALAMLEYWVDTTGIETDDNTQGADARFKISLPGTEYSGITIDTAASYIRKEGDETYNVYAFQGAALYQTLLGDIAGPNYYDSVYLQNKAPKMLPAPDGRIDGEDVIAFVLAWDGDDIGNQDPLADIFPTLSWKSGARAPYLFARPDCYWEADDIIAFSEMYSWYASFGASPSLAKSGKITEYSEDELPLQFKYVDGSLFHDLGATFDVYANDVKNLLLARAILDFNSDEIEVLSIDEYDFMSKDGGNSTLFKDAKNGSIDLVSASFSRGERGVSGSGVIARVVLKAKGAKITGDLEYSYQLFNTAGKLIDRKLTRIDKSVLNELGVPRNFALGQNYPNPFNPTTEIRYSMAKAGRVSLKVYNITGELVKTLVNEYKPAGRYSVKWNGKARGGFTASAGVYFYRFETEGFKETRKMLLLK